MVTTAPRPTLYDEAVEAAAVDAVLPKVMEWLKQGNGEDNAAGVREDLAECINDGDGYRICVGLSNHSGWDCDSELVEILDSAAYALHLALRNAEEQWVKATGQTPAIPVGGAVTFTQFGVSHIGEVTKHDPRGYYIVYCEALGHVREGVGTHGTYVKWEDAV